ncbi:MAG UNVERIFIED_CONTAM: hypothetical protein LVT10_19645 [Anaerolineae bacterium]
MPYRFRWACCGNVPSKWVPAITTRPIFPYGYILLIIFQTDDAHIHIWEGQADLTRRGFLPEGVTMGRGGCFAHAESFHDDPTAQAFKLTFDGRRQRGRATNAGADRA